jgi:hypothetical protein
VGAAPTSFPLGVPREPPGPWGLPCCAPPPPPATTGCPHSHPRDRLARTRPSCLSVSACAVTGRARGVRQRWAVWPVRRERRNRMSRFRGGAVASKFDRVDSTSFWSDFWSNCTSVTAVATSVRQVWVATLAYFSFPSAHKNGVWCSLGLMYLHLYV